MNLYVTGDIHGEFIYLFDYLLKTLNNSTVIVAGDCGFGFDDIEYYFMLFDEFEVELSKKQIYVYFMRGNHDNPKYFDLKLLSSHHYEHIKLLKDYDIIFNNILIIGGATSSDKAYRKINVSYWTGEEIKKYDDLSTFDWSNIDTIISHECPNICSPFLPQISSLDGIYISKRTRDKINKDRSYLTKIFNYVRPKKWFYGHYHVESKENIDGCEFVCCKMLSPENGECKLYKI